MHTDKEGEMIGGVPFNLWQAVVLATVVSGGSFVIIGMILNIGVLAGKLWTVILALALLAVAVYLLGLQRLLRVRRFSSIVRFVKKQMTFRRYRHQDARFVF